MTRDQSPEEMSPTKKYILYDCYCNNDKDQKGSKTWGGKKKTDENLDR